jgi:hypothetical protein
VVEGAHLRTGRDDVAKHGVHIPEHVASRDAQDAEAFAPEHHLTRSVAARLIAEAVAFPVDLDDEPPFEASEVDGHFAEGKLLPELVAIRSFAKLLPEEDLRKTHLFSQFTCALHLLNGRSKNLRIDPAWAPSTTRLRRAVPLPVPGRI